ncbi:hypothetical protein B0H14DRAFT_2602184 [Mycena olivaceomarginata]|nr:hypothetical protein B0H14DRAFT_2602184 [Mycena olivaceomarginata]
MIDDVPSQMPSAANSKEELAALVSQVAALSKLAVDLSERCLDVNDKALSKLALEVTRHCIDIHDKIPHVVRVQVDAAVALYHNAPAFFENIAPTPDEMGAEYPPGRGDNQAWYVVCVGRQPGFYVTSYRLPLPPVRKRKTKSPVSPRGYRRRVAGRIAALAYYRQMYDQGKVRRLNEEPEPLDQLSQPV